MAYHVSPGDPEWNWVAALSECSATITFEALKLDIESDVKKRNAIIPPGVTAWRFATARHNDSLIVSLTTPRTHPSVTFTLAENMIVVRDEGGKPILDATLTLNDEGECRFKIDGKEYESWQLRKRALERLFFELDHIF